MGADALVRVEGVSKKYCKSLKRSMLYGISDISRNLLGLSSRPGQLREDEFWAVDNVSFELKKGETLGIIGPNGSGKTTLLKMLNGIFWPDKGKITIKGKVGALIEVGAGFHPLLTGRENIYVNAAILGMTKKEVDRKFDSIVGFADIGDFLDTPVKNYSSGMFVRLGFSVAVHCRPDILLIDEVLAVGDIDFQSKCFNELGRLRQAGITTILVSHSIMHILGFCDKVLYMNKGEVRYYGTADKAIEMYQNDMACKKRTPSSFKFERENARGSGKIKLIGIDFLDEKEKPIDTINAGDSLVLRAYYSAAEDVGPVELDVAIGGHGSGILFRASSKAYRKELVIQKGGGYVDVNFDKFCLNNQILLFYLALWKSDRSELFDWVSEVPFCVKGDVRSGGKVLLNIDWSNYQGASL